MKNNRAWVLIPFAVLGVSLLIEQSHRAQPVAKEAPERLEVDHPLWRGKLTGKAGDQAMEEFTTAIFKTGPDDPDRRKVFNQYLEPLGVKRMVRLFEERKPHCHGILHDLGYVIEEKVRDLETSLSLCQDACTFACIHGVLKARFTSKQVEGLRLDDPAEGTTDPPPSSGLDTLRKEILHLCREDSRSIRDFYRGNCAHAVGHAFAQIDRNLSGAVRYCAMFDGPEMQFYCHTGVFMELEEEVAARLHTENMTPEGKRTSELRYCTGNDEWTSACMRFTPQGPPKSFDVLRWIASECDQLEGRRRRECFNGLGFMSRYYIVSHPEEVGRVCNRGDAIDRKLCVSGIFSVKKDHRWTRRLETVCHSLVDAEFREVCRNELKHPYYKLGNPMLELMFSGT
jgi:hypothetical protein